MAKPEDGFEWIWRIGSGVVVGATAFAILSYWNTWDFSVQARALIAVGAGAVFMVIGGSVWKWIEAMDFWS